MPISVPCALCLIRFEHFLEAQAAECQDHAAWEYPRCGFRTREFVSMFFPEAFRRVLLLKAAANFTCQLLMSTFRQLFHLPTSHVNFSRVISPANFSCQLFESYFICQLLMPTFRELLHLPTSHANSLRVTAPAKFSCQLLESFFTSQLLMSTFRVLSHDPKNTS